MHVNGQKNVSNTFMNNSLGALSFLFLWQYSFLFKQKQKYVHEHIFTSQNTKIKLDQLESKCRTMDNKRIYLVLKWETVWHSLSDGKKDYQIFFVCLGNLMAIMEVEGFFLNIPHCHWKSLPFQNAPGVIIENALDERVPIIIFFIISKQNK